MSVAKVIEITADSETGFEDAIQKGIRKASETVDNIRAAWVANQEVTVDGSTVKGYRVHMRVTFVLND
jgi:flavin-binding protein dodecin